MVPFHKDTDTCCKPVIVCRNIFGSNKAVFECNIYVGNVLTKEKIVIL